MLFVTQTLSIYNLFEFICKYLREYVRCHVVAVVHANVVEYVQTKSVFLLRVTCSVSHSLNVELNSSDMKEVNICIPNSTILTIMNVYEII